MSKRVGLAGVTGQRQAGHTGIQATAIQRIEAQSPFGKAAMKKATFNLPEELHYRLKVAAASTRREMVDIVIEALAQYLKERQL